MSSIYGSAPFTGCYFCLRSPEMVSRLISSPAHFNCPAIRICDQCVEKAMYLLLDGKFGFYDETHLWPEEPPPQSANAVPAQAANESPEERQQQNESPK